MLSRDIKRASCVFIMKCLICGQNFICTKSCLKESDNCICVLCRFQYYSLVTTKQEFKAIFKVFNKCYGNVVKEIITALI